MFGSLVFLVGLLFFVVWAIRDLKAKTLMKVSLVLLVLGLLMAGLTMKYGMRMMQHDKDGMKGGRMMEGYEEIDDTPGSDEEEVVEEDAE